MSTAAAARCIYVLIGLIESMKRREGEGEGEEDQGRGPPYIYEAPNRFSDRL